MPNSEQLPALSLRRFAQLLKVSPSTVSAWCASGMPHGRSGKRTSVIRIDLESALPWVVTNAAMPARDSQRERLAKEQADRVALENGVRRKELGYVSHFWAIASAAVSALNNELEGMPARIAHQVAAINDPAEARVKLQDEIRDVRTAFSARLGALATLGPGAIQPVQITQKPPTTGRGRRSAR